MRKIGFWLMAAAWLMTATTAQAQEQGPPTELPALKNHPQNQGGQRPEVLPPPTQTDGRPNAPEAQGQEGSHQDEAVGARPCRRKSGWHCFCDWLTYHPLPPPRHCFRCQPIPRRPPLYYYFLDRAVSREGHCHSRQ